MGNAVATGSGKAKKAIHVPGPGDYLTDGERLVEVLGKDRRGIRVIDVNVPSDVGEDDCDPRALMLLTTKAAVEEWRLVKPEEQHVA